MYLTLNLCSHILVCLGIIIMSYSLYSCFKLSANIKTSGIQHRCYIIQILIAFFLLSYIVLEVYLAIRGSNKILTVVSTVYFLGSIFVLIMVSFSRSTTGQLINMNNEQLELQKQMLISSKLSAVGELSAGMFHEINNILTVLFGSQNIIKREVKVLNNEKLDNMLLKQGTGFQRILDITNSLRTYMRNKSDGTHQTFDVHNIVTEVILLLETLYKGHNISISSQMEASISMIEGNPGKLHQLLMNLLSNAKDAIIDKGVTDGRIGITTYNTPKNELIIQIKDNGKGIPKEHQDKIFKLLYTTKGDQSGTGLGLSIVQSLAENMNGKVTFESYENVGTIFLVTFKNPIKF